MSILLGVLAVLTIYFFIGYFGRKSIPVEVKDYPKIEETFFEKKDPIPSHYLKKGKKLLNSKKLTKKKILSYNWRPIYEQN